jgi:hypothetical protein
VEIFIFEELLNGFASTNRGGSGKKGIIQEVLTQMKLLKKNINFKLPVLVTLDQITTVYPDRQH